MGGAPIDGILEYVRSTHIPLLPPHQVILTSDETSCCDIKARIVRLALKSKFLEWDYRHEIEHLNRYPRREGILFKHYFKARRILMEKHEYSELELFKKYFKQIANITYDSYIDYELAQKYPKVKCEIEHYIRNLPAEALTYPHEEARKHAINGVKPKWLESDIPRTMVYVYERIKSLLKQNLKLKVNLDVELHGDLSEIAFGALELIDEGYSYNEVAAVAEEYCEVAGRKFDQLEFTDKLIDELIRSRFQFTVKATFDTKIAFNEVRECWNTWRLGESIDELEFNESLRSYGILIPGQNTLKKTTIPARRGVLKHRIGGAHIAILADCSGSMKKYDKWIYCRDAVLMLIGFALKYRYDVCLSIFTDYNVWCHEWTSNYYELARKFVKRYNPNKMNFHSYTSITSSLHWLSCIGKINMTTYLISDMEVEEIRDIDRDLLLKLVNYKPRIVFFLINSNISSLDKLAEKFSNAGLSDIASYWVNPRNAERLRDKVIKEVCGKQCN